MLAPRKVKHRKHQKGRSRNRTYESRGTTLSFGSYGLKSLDLKWVSSTQLEAARRAILRYLKKGGKMWLRVFPNKVVTKKGVEVPMGGGKGAPDHFVFPVKPGRIIFELEGIDEKTAQAALRKAADKLPIRTKFVKR